MEDAIISKLYSKGFETTPSLCRYGTVHSNDRLDSGLTLLDVTVTRQGGRKVLLDTQLSGTVILTRLLVAGQAIRVEKCRLSVKADTGSRCEIGNFFSIPSTPISFAIYLGFKKPRQEGTLVEAKFQQSQFAAGGFTWDIVCNESFQDEFHVSLKVHVFSAAPQRRVDISYETKSSTSLHIIPSDDSSETSGIERQILQKLVESPPSKTRTDALLINGLSLFAQFERTHHAQYLDLSILALFPCRPYIDIRTRPRCERRLYIIHILFSHFLFIRCTLSDGDAFVLQAFDALKEVNIIPTEDNEFLEPFVRSILPVLERHNYSDHRTSAFPVIVNSITALRKNGSTPEFQFDSVPIWSTDIPLTMKTKEELSCLDHTLPLIAPHLPVEMYGKLLIRKAMSYLRLYATTSDISHDLVVTAVESVQHFLDRCDTELKPTEIFLEIIRVFLYAAGAFFTDRTSMRKAGPERFAMFLTSCFAFLDWGIPVELRMEPGGAPPELQAYKAAAQRNLWIAFQHGVEGGDELAKASRWMKEVIQVVYSETAIRDGLLDIMHDQMMDLALGIVRPSPVHGPTETMDAIVEYSLSVKPHDHITMIRVIIAATISRTFDSPVTMRAYHLLMSSVELLDWTWLMSAFRDHISMTVPSITSDAISCASDLGCYELAVEWADRCSSMAWNRIVRCRSPFTQVAAVNPELAEKLTNLASKLLTLPPAFVDHSPDDDLHYTICVTDWQNTVREVRKLPGLERFLAPNAFSEIQSAVNALGGPVVFFDVSRFYPYALCVIPNLEDVVPIPLTDLNLEELKAFTRFFGYLLDGTGNEEIIVEGRLRSRVGKLVKNHKRTRKYIGVPLVLEYLWIVIVKPVLDGLAISRSESSSAEKLPRIWWCPSGPLETFPFHAAGLYDGSDEDNAMDYIVSSYIPSSVLASHVTRIEIRAPSPSFLAVANPAGSRLPGTEQELDLICKYLVDAGPVTKLVGGNVTPDAVKQGLHAATWAHFACHGMQVEADEPQIQTCCLILANHKRLTLAEISRLSLPHAQFAFLSACETAQERRICAGESVHIAAGMLVAGFRSVIGTMWKISDEYAPDLADLFYQKMFEGTQAGQVPDYRRSAYALHDAVREFRGRGVDFKIWVPFLHYGA